LEVTGNTTLTGTVAVAGVATFAAAPVFSAGAASLGTVSAQAAPIINTVGGYVADYVQSLTDYAALTDTGGSSKAGFQAILGYGVTKIRVTGTSGTTAGSTANDLVFRLNPPIKAGVHKYIFLSGASASTKVVSVRTLTSATGSNFYGSTYNAVAWTTTINNPSDALHLIGMSTAQWGLVNRKMSTAAALAGATA